MPFFPDSGKLFMEALQTGKRRDLDDMVCPRVMTISWYAVDGHYMNELADRIMDEGIAKGADPVIGIQMGMLADT